MKKKEGQVDHEHQLILYVEQDDESYGPLQTGSYAASNYLDDYLQKRQKYTGHRLQELLDGQISPIAYYADLVELAEGDLAIRVGLSRRKVRKHYTPEGFSGLSVKLLQRYAEVLTIPVAMLFQVFDYEQEQSTVKSGSTAQQYLSRTIIRTKDENE
ncbi:MAG: hypothetical protein ABFS19_09235 [Thermodesulfobacteriota bacterium]